MHASKERERQELERGRNKRRRWNHRRQYKIRSKIRCFRLLGRYSTLLDSSRIRISIQGKSGKEAKGSILPTRDYSSSPPFDDNQIVIEQISQLLIEGRRRFVEDKERSQFVVSTFCVPLVDLILSSLSSSFPSPPSSACSLFPLKFR